MTQIVPIKLPRSTGSEEHASRVGVGSGASSEAVAAVYIIAFAKLGTGGVSIIDWSRANARTGPFTIVREGAAEEPLTTADRVLLLRRWLSLSVAEAARALHVQRPTVYSWQDGKAPAAPKNLERLRVVFDLAREWRAMSSTPIGSLRKEPLGPGGKPLMDLLSADEVSRAQIRETMKRIVDAMTRQEAQRPMSGAELAKRYRFQSLREAEVVENITRESSRGARKNGEP
jgi:DNA-binding transcriptional regulator YiaG